MLSRIEALEAFLRDDTGGENEAFDYQQFIETRNVAEPVAAKEASINLPELEKEIEATKQKTLQKSNAIDSESESEAEDALQDALQDEPQDDQPTRSRGAARGALDSDSEAETEPKTKNKTQTKPQPRKKRDTRLQTEQGLARMKRQLDKTIELHTKAKPSLSQFLAGFEASEPASAPAQPSGETEGDVYLDSSDEDEPQSASTPDANQAAKPLYYPTDNRSRWLEAVNLQQVRQTQQRLLENSKEFEGDEDEGEGENVQEDEETQAQMATDQVEPEYALDSLPRLAKPERTIDNLDLDFGSGSEDEADSEEDPEPKDPKDPNEDSEDESTPVDDSQVLAETQAAPIDPEALRELFRKQRKELDDSDSESESEPEAESVNKPMEFSQEASQDDDLLNLPSSQIGAELGRKFQQNNDDAYEFFDRQAQESDEDGGIAPTDDDEDSADDDTGVVENLVDDATKQTVDEDELRALYQAGEQERDEQLTTHIRRDIVGGGWKTKKLLGKTGMLSDDEDEENNGVTVRRIKRAKLMENSILGKLASKEKTRAFAESMMDELLHQHDTLDDSCESVRDSLKFLQEEDVEIVVPGAPSQEAAAAADNAVEEEPKVLPVVAALQRSSRERTMSSRNQSSIYRPIPSVHAAPTLSGKHTSTRRARIQEKPQKKQPITAQSRRGLGFHTAWGR